MDVLFHYIIFLNVFKIWMHKMIWENIPFKFAFVLRESLKPLSSIVPHPKCIEIPWNAIHLIPTRSQREPQSIRNPNKTWILISGGNRISWISAVIQNQIKTIAPKSTHTKIWVSKIHQIHQNENQMSHAR